MLTLDLARIRDRLSAAAHIRRINKSHGVGTDPRTFMAYYLQDVRALRSAHRRERTGRIGWETLLIVLCSELESGDGAGVHPHVTADRIRSWLAIRRDEPLPTPQQWRKRAETRP